MTKIITIPSSLEQLKDIINDCDGIIIGLKDMSVNMPCYFSLIEIIEINKLLKENNKELFVSLNKNMHNKDLEYLKEVLTELEKLDINGILYYDISLVNLKQELNLNIDLVFSQEHATTNYATINYWYNMGANYTYLSNEITLNEILEIKNNTKCKLMVQVLGYIPMFVSERKLINNYLKYFNLNDNSKKYYLEKENKIYNVVENKDATILYSNSILNGIKELNILKENNVEYAILNSFQIEESIFKHILININTIEDKEIDELLKNTTKGFLYTETVYKVKNYE